MLTALALAAVLQQDTYVDDAGCLWRRKPAPHVVVRKAPTAAKPASAPASSPVKHKAKRKTVAKQPEGDEFLGCPEETPVAPTLPPAAIVPEPEPEAPFTPMPLDAAPPPTDVLSPPVTFEEGCDCGAPPGGVFYFTGGGGFYAPAPRGPVSAIPEPGAAWLLLVGLVAVAFKARRA